MQTSGSFLHLWVGTALALATGCVQTPSGATSQSGAIIELSGVTTSSDQIIGFYFIDRRLADPTATPPDVPTENRIFVPNFQCGGQQCFEWQPLEVHSSLEPRRTRSGRSLGVYDWSVSIPPVARYSFDPPLTLAADAWSPQDPSARAVVHGPGRVEIAAYVMEAGVPTTRLRTHTDGLVLNGDTYVAHDDDGVSLVATPPSGWHGTRLPSGLAGVDVEFGTYDVPGVPDPVQAVMCHPVAAGDARIRTLILNHGGANLGHTPDPFVRPEDLEFCMRMAARGWRVAMSAYRGFGVTRDALFPAGPRLADALPVEIESEPAPGLELSEFCTGEVLDVLRWTELVRARSDTLTSRVLMMGGSHGGCVTLRAVEQGADVHAAIALAPITDFRFLYARGLHQHPTTWAASAAPFYGGPPAGPPSVGALESRSPVRFTTDLLRRDDVPLLVGAALGDSVVPPQHACELATVLGTENHFLGPTGVFLGTSPVLTDTVDDDAFAPACGTVPRWETTTAVPTGWPARRYFLLWDYGSAGSGGAIHVTTSLYEPWDMMGAMRSAAITDFIANFFGS